MNNTNYKKVNKVKEGNSWLNMEKAEELYNSFIMQEIKADYEESWLNRWIHRMEERREEEKRRLVGKKRKRSSYYIEAIRKRRVVRKGIG